jgi:hypothetical protein
MAFEVETLCSGKGFSLQVAEVWCDGKLPGRCYNISAKV